VTLDAARKYCMPALEKECVSVVKEAISYKNACEFFSKSHNLAHDELHKFCRDFVLNNFTDVRRSDGFLKMSKNRLPDLFHNALKADEIDVCFVMREMYICIYTFFHVEILCASQMGESSF